MNNSALNKRAAILSKIPSRSMKSIKVPGRYRNEAIIPGSQVGFAPVEITDRPVKENDLIEVLFPSGVQVILSGSQSLSSLASLLKLGY